MAQTEATKIGRYELQGLLGRGGMAEVYRAFDPRLQRQVAIKVILPSLASEEDSTDQWARRFQNEARAVAKLTHPHIAQVFDFGDSELGPYMVMEYVAGQTLKEKIKQAGQGLPSIEVVQIVQAIGSALDYAHSQGIIHRDIKPTNIMFRSDGAPTLTDFGISRLLDATQMTHSSSLTGTPAYLAPEQASGNPVAQSDLYSLGVVLFEMLTGRPPFSANSLTEMVMKHVQGTPPTLRSIRSELPAALETVIQKALAKKPEDRYQYGADLAAAVQQAFFAIEKRETDATPEQFAKTVSEESNPPLSASEIPLSAHHTHPATTHSIFALFSIILGRNIAPPDTTKGKLGLVTWVMGIIGALSAGLQVFVSTTANLNKAADLLLPYLLPITIGLLALGLLVAVRVAMLWPDYRRHAYSAIAVTLLVGGGWGSYTAYEQWRPPNGKLVLVSRFPSCDGTTVATGNARSIYLTLRRQGQQLDPPVDARYDANGFSEDAEAHSAAQQRLANLVIWGCERQDATDLRFDLIGPLEEENAQIQLEDARTLLTFGYPLYNPQKLEHVTFFTLGLIRYIEGDAEGAFGFFERAINNLGNEQERVGAYALYFYRAMSGWKSGQPMSAVVIDLETAKSFDPSILEIRHNLSIAYADSCTEDGRERIDEALVENESVIKGRRNNALPFEVRGRLLAMQLRWAEAAQSFEEALKRPGASTGLYAELSQAYRKAGNESEAERTLKLAHAQTISTTATLAQPVSSTALLIEEADLYWYAGDYHAAARRYTDAITQAQDEKLPAEAIARLYFDQSLAWFSAKEWRNAVEAAEASLALAPSYFGLQHKTGVNPSIVLGMAYNKVEDQKRAMEYFDLALQKKPCDSSALYERALLYQQQENLEAALKDFQAAAYANPYNPFASYQTTYLMEALGAAQSEIALAYAETVQRLTHFVKNEPNNAAAHFALAMMLAESGDRKQAEAARARAIELDPGYLDQPLPISGGALELSEQAQQAWESGDSVQAIAWLEQALELEPDNHLFLMTLGMYRLTLGQLDAAEEAFTEVTTLKPDYAAAYSMLSTVYGRQNENAKQLAALQTATELEPQNAINWTQLAQAYWRAAELEKAVEPARRATLLQPEDPLSHGVLGMILADSARYSDALPSLERAVELSPTYEFAAYYLGNTYVQLSRHDEAIVTLQRALTHHPQSVPLLTALTTAFTASGESEMALQNARRASEMLPDSLEMRSYYAYLLYEQGRFSESIPEFIAALQILPGDPNAQLGLGYAHLAMNQLDEAAAALQAVLAEDFNNLYALAGMGYLYARQGKLDQAMDYTARAAKIDAQHLVVQQAQAWIERIKGNEVAARKRFEAVLAEPQANAWHKLTAQQALDEE
jgi:serine/threonine protein kinase/Tfp pilus assembly protein PilF